mmetsp:Transcript_47003/g.109901  ORF Transcript_47003/g.109901 Transcript_47003/m.109901 type:complete len:82 (+) Transcript_47003:149-394(+)
MLAVLTKLQRHYAKCLESENACSESLSAFDENLTSFRMAMEQDQWAEALSFVTVLKKDQERLRRHIEEGWQHRRSRNCTDP